MRLSGKRDECSLLMVDCADTSFSGSGSAQPVWHDQTAHSEHTRTSADIYLKTPLTQESVARWLQADRQCGHQQAGQHEGLHGAQVWLPGASFIGMLVQPPLSDQEDGSSGSGEWLPQSHQQAQRGQLTCQCERQSRPLAKRRRARHCAGDYRTLLAEVTC